MESMFYNTVSTIKIHLCNIWYKTQYKQKIESVNRQLQQSVNSSSIPDSSALSKTNYTREDWVYSTIYFLMPEKQRFLFIRYFRNCRRWNCVVIFLFVRQRIVERTYRIYFLSSLSQYKSNNNKQTTKYIRTFFRDVADHQ